MFEPRGHADMYGAIIVDAERDNSHFGAVFIHNEGYSTMCGHAIIALAKFAVEAGVVKKTGQQTQVIIDVPCGQIIAQAFSDKTDEQITSVTFNGVPSFQLLNQQNIFIDGIGKVTFDLGFGGAFYAYVDARSLKLSLDKNNSAQLIHYGKLIKRAVSDNFKIKHPFVNDLSFLYGTIFYDDSFFEQKSSLVARRNVCIFANGELDRSPTGSGVSGRIAIEYAKGKVNLHQELTIESILGSQFKVKAIETLNYGPHQAVIAQVSGSAFICGRSQWYIDANDPLKDGFLLAN